MMRILTLEQADEWQRVLARTTRHDFYFLPGYHALAEARGEGTARLFVYEEGEYLLALPLLVRSLSGITELGDEAEGWHDATSVYGYAGPLRSCESVPDHVTRAFQAALRAALLEQRVVAAFSRLHPLLSQSDLLDALGECHPCGQTISIDLTLSPADQRAQYRGTLRSRINKLRETGFTWEALPHATHMEEFVSIYHETMRRVNAHDSYFFSHDYFVQLSQVLRERLLLCAVKCGGEIVSAGLFTLCDGVLQYHLGATRDAFLKHSPMTLLLDGVRLWGTEQGARVFHLGGGVGARQDSLFQFKCGFSECRHDFSTWRWIVAPEIFHRLCEERHRWNAEHALEPVSSGYFPAYRCPAMARTPQAAAALPVTSWLLAAAEFPF